MVRATRMKVYPDRAGSTGSCRQECRDIKARTTVPVNSASTTISSGFTVGSGRGPLPPRPPDPRPPPRPPPRPRWPLLAALLTSAPGGVSEPGVASGASTVSATSTSDADVRSSSRRACWLRCCWPSCVATGGRACLHHECSAWYRKSAKEQQSFRRVAVAHSFRSNDAITF